MCISLRSAVLALVVAALGPLLLASLSPAALAPLPGARPGSARAGGLLDLDARGDGIDILVESDPDLSDESIFHRGRLRGGPLSPVMTGEGVLFRFRDEDAHSVSVVGEFNDWDETATPMRRTRNGVWRTTIDLDSGRWSYLYVVDGEWLTDPDNPVLRPAKDAEGESLGETSHVRIRHDEVVLPRPRGFHEGDAGLSGRYDRVDQVSLTGTLSYRNRAELHPELTLAGGYSFGRERWLYDIAATQPLIDAEVLDVGAAVYRRTDTPDRHRFGDTENTLAAFFFREDWRDYHEAEGVSIHGRAYLGSSQDLVVTWRDEDHRSLSKTTDWGLFGGNKRMRANPPIDAGTLRSIVVDYALDTRNSLTNPTRGLLATGAYEWAGGELGGDFEFRRGVVDARRYAKLSPGHFFDLRLTAGRIDDARRSELGEELEGFDAIPRQERFYLGGVGTMRATQFKSISGDRMLLANAEIRVEVYDDLQVAVFTDVGDAWVADDRDASLHTDAGIGIQDSDGSFRLNLAKKIDREDDEGFFVSARIRRMF
jgi:outer membrane protein insertion porin family